LTVVANRDLSSVKAVLGSRGAALFKRSAPVFQTGDSM
jgi:hypothetical protein